MTKSEIESFIESNSIENIKSYFDKLVDKLEVTHRSNDKILIWMLLLIFVYFSVGLNIFSKIKVGPITLTDDSFIKLFTPMIFNFLFLKYATLNVHRSTLISNIRQVGGHIYNLEGGIEQNSTYSNISLQMIMPFSIWEEINSKYMTDGKSGCITGIIFSPLFLLLISPLIFEYIVVKDLLLDFWCNGWGEKAVILTTLWMFIGVTIYYFNAFKKKIKDNKNARC
ncbi:hypothetical protein [Saccharicrinis aurantiacus]|uniref:hypothetical protein n=1 Tax=Saccharicrinis aurantiacus TaxID=1849719 RepID=UPI002491CBD2|nr:hypothetical protein [Saccharicrinis aurantiacus]